MEKEREKKGGLARLGRLFQRSKPAEPEPAPEETPGPRGVHRSPSDLGPPAGGPPEEGQKRRSLGSWRVKRQQRSSLDSGSEGASGGSRSPPPDTVSLATGDRSFEISDEDHSIPDMAVFPETDEEPQIIDFSLEIASAYTNSQGTLEKSRAQPTETSKKEAAKKPVLAKFGNLFSSTKKRSSKSNPSSPTSPNSEKAVSLSKDVVCSKSSDKEGLKDKTRTQGSGTLDSKGRNVIGAKGSPVEAPSGSPRKRATLNQLPKKDDLPGGSGREKERDSKLSFNGLPPAPESVSETSGNKPIASLQGSSSGDTGEENGSASETQITRLNGSRERLPLPLQETHTDQESDKNPSQEASPTGKETGASAEGTDARKAKLVFRLSKPENAPPSASDETEVSLNSHSSPCDANIPNPSVPPGEGGPGEAHDPSVPPGEEGPGGAQDPSVPPGEGGPGGARDPSVPPGEGGPGGARDPSVPPGEGGPGGPQDPSVPPGEAQEDANGTTESAEKTSESPNPTKVLTVDIYLSKAVEADSRGPAAPSTPTVAPADTEPAMERRANSNRKASKKRRSFRFNAITTDEQLAEELGEAERSPPPQGQNKGPAASPESSTSPTLGGAANHRVPPKGKQQQPPPSAPAGRKDAREGQPPSPTARKSQQQAPAVQGGQAAAAVVTTKGAAAPRNRTTPPPSPQGSPTAGDAPRTPSADSSPESRKLLRETSAAKRGPPSTGKRDLEKSAERLAEAPRHQSNAAATRPKPTQTSKLHIPARPKSVDFSVKTKRSESLESIEETAFDPQIKGNTAKKISLFENKTSNQSHRQIDFYATKSIPLTKKYVGRAKLKFGKEANEAEQVDISTSQQDVAQNYLENGRPVHKGIEEIKVKFESAMEVETVAKIEAKNGTSPKKKGNTGGPNPIQPQKAAVQVNSEQVESLAGEVAVNLDSMMPDTAPPQHDQINDEQDSATKMKEACTQPHESTTTLLEGETEQDKPARPGQNVDLCKPISQSTIVDSSIHAAADENSIKSLTEQVFSPKESCVESLENTISSRGKKNSVKSPSRKGEKPTFKKNDRPKKKKPTGTPPPLVQEHLLVQQPKESAEKLKSPKDVVDALTISTTNVSTTVESICGSKPPQQGTSRSVDDIRHNGNNVLAEVEEKVLQEITDISEQTNCGVESSQDGVELPMGSSDHAQAAPTTDIYEFSHNYRETALNSFPSTVLEDTCLDTVENDRNAKGETNESISVNISESTKKALCEDARGLNADLGDGAYLTVTESTKEELSGNGKIQITYLNENTSFTTTESKKVHGSENAECAITDSSEDTLVSTGESTTAEISDSCLNSMSDFDKIEPLRIGESIKKELSENARHAVSDSSKGAFAVPGESTKTELSDDQGNVILVSDQRESLTSESPQSELSENWEDAVADLNEIPHFDATTNSELTDTKELVNSSDTRQENKSQDSVTLQQCSFELHKVEVTMPTVNLEKIKTISQEPDASPQDQLQNISDVPQSEEIIVVLKSQEAKDILQKEKDILSQLLPDKRGQNFSDMVNHQARAEGTKENRAAQKAEHQISKDQVRHEGERPLADCPKGIPKIEAKCQNEDPAVQSGAPDTHQNIDTHKQNVHSSVQELYALNLHFSSGSVGNGMPFDRNGMFNSKSPSGVFTFSATSDENHLDSSGEMEKFTEIIRQLDSPSTAHQKRKKQRIPRSPQPSFGLAPIREDYLEKIFDSDLFTFGLGKKERAIDLAPSLMLKMQNTDNATRIRPKRASTEQSFLVKSLRATSKDASLTNEDIDGKENNPDVRDPEVKRSRLEKSTLFSSLKSPLMATSKENVFSPSVTLINTITTSFATSQCDSSCTSPNSFDATTSLKTYLMSETAQSSIPDQGSYDSISSDIPTYRNTSLAGLKVPRYVEQYLKTDDEKQAQNLLSVGPLTEIGCTELQKTDSASSSDPKNVSSLLESIPKIHSSTLPGTDGEFLNRLNPSLAELNPTLKVLEMEAGVGNGHKKVNPRPGKVVIFGEPNFCGHFIEVFADVPDCSSWELSEVISIKIVRGCWLLYEKPNFEGLSIPLEEGEMELTNLWGEQIADEKSTSPTVIGSLRQVVKDYRICQIDLFTESDGLGLVTSYFDDTEEVQVYDRLQKTCSIKVHWGIWLIYEDSGFQGVPFILEPGEYPNLAFWDTHEAYIGSMRPLKMGGRKVEIPNEPKIFVYEKPFFEGMELELDGEMSSLGEAQTVPKEEQSGKEQTLSFTTVASMRVLGGVWVGYEKPGFEGHQYLLEEGDYPLWSDWGGYNEQLQSLRPVLSDFSTTHMIMYSDRDFGEKGSNINVLGIISNMEDTGYGTKTQSINVLSGVWVAYENADFTGEQYVLEKGKYSRFEDWGAKSFKISSVQPIMLDSIGSPMGKFKVLLFSEPEFRGSVQAFEDNISQIPDSFVTNSCKVLAGSWVAFEGEEFGGCQYILEEGAYPNLCSMGCQASTTLKSLHVIDYEFSEPVILLYGKQLYKGKKIEFTFETVSLPCLGYTSHVSSVEVLGGQWVIYEYSNYRGRQILLSPDKIPDWYTISGWHTIGSLRPIIQKRVYFRIRNKSTGMFIGTNGNLDDLKLLRLQVTEHTLAEDQIWAYHEGFLKCRIAEDCCVAVSGSLVISGSKLSLSLEEEKSDSQFWRIGPDGRIQSRMKPNLVFDIKGGTQYDQKHVVLNTVCAEKDTQCWELLVL